VSRTRTLTAGLAVAALLVTAVPASAATTTFAAEASSDGLTVSLAGNELLEAAGTFASAVPGEALAVAIPVAIGGTPIGEREAASDGPAVFDPAEGEDACLAEVPEPLASLLGAGVACADAYAEGDIPAAGATAGVGQLNVLQLDGADLGPINELLATLPLDDLLEVVEGQLLAQLSEAFGDVRTECIAALQPLNIAGLLDPVLEPLADASPEEIAALLETLDTLLVGAVPLACEILGDIADVLLGGDLFEAITSGDILAQLAGAEGVLSITLIETASDVARDGDDVVAVAGPAEGGAIRVVVDIPLLDELIGDLLEGAIAPVLAALTDLLAPVADAVEPLPEVGPIVADLLTSGSLGALLEGPLLSVGIAPGEAFAEGDLSTGETGGVASPALAEFGGTLFELPVLEGLDDALNAIAQSLDDNLLAALRDSELADVVSVELLPGSVEDAEVGGLSGTQATSGTASLELLGVITETAGGPLLAVDVAPALAGVGIGTVTDTTTPVEPSGPDATPVTPTPEQLPVTGGGAALLGLAALGAAAALRRRG
jgi:hypothetical protein